MSIELPDGKICRSLPEQVAENAKNIKTILEILDGLNIQDNLVVIADISQILTRSELDIVERPVAFLYYGDQLYIKKNEVGGSAFFDVIFSISGSTVISFASKEIEVNLSTGALSLTTSTVSTYSKSELDTLLSAKSDITYVDAQLAGKADLSGANFTGAITAPSIIENMSGYSVVFPKISVFQTSTQEAYCGICKNGNKITFAVSGQITPSENISSGSDMTLCSFTIPSAVGEKLIPFAGGQRLSYKSVKCFYSSTNSVEITFIMTKTSNTSFYITCITTSTLSDSNVYSFRYEETFLLSENLAE